MTFSNLEEEVKKIFQSYNLPPPDNEIIQELKKPTLDDDEMMLRHDTLQISKFMLKNRPLSSDDPYPIDEIVIKSTTGGSISIKAKTLIMDMLESLFSSYSGTTDEDIEYVINQREKAGHRKNRTKYKKYKAIALNRLLDKYCFQTITDKYCLIYKLMFVIGMKIETKDKRSYYNAFSPNNKDDIRARINRMING